MAQLKSCGLQTLVPLAGDTLFCAEVAQHRSTSTIPAAPYPDKRDGCCILFLGLIHHPGAHGIVVNISTARLDTDRSDKDCFMPACTDVPPGDTGDYSIEHNQSNSRCLFDNRICLTPISRCT